MSHEFPDGVWRARLYWFHEFGKWKTEHFRGESDEETDAKAIDFLTRRPGGAVAAIIRNSSRGRQHEVCIWQGTDLPYDHQAAVAVMKQIRARKQKSVA